LAIEQATECREMKVVALPAADEGGFLVLLTDGWLQVLRRAPVPERVYAV
jgi:hypothetical protein